MPAVAASEPRERELVGANDAVRHERRRPAPRGGRREICPVWLGGHGAHLGLGVPIRHMRRAFTATACLALSTIPALAADPLFTAAPVATDDWIVTLKGTVGVGPRFAGSDRQSVFGYPSVSFRRAGEAPRFSAPDDSLDYAVYDSATFRAGPVLNYRAGRYTGQDHRLIGLDDVRWTVEPGVFLEYWAAPWLRARAELRHGMRGYEGFVADLGLDLVHRTGALTLAAGPRLTLGDSDYTRNLYGITFREATLNGLLLPYRPGGGATSVGAAASLGYQWSEAWTTTVFGGYRRLVGDPADSPIVRVIGSPNQFEAGVSLSYAFRTRW
jgi:outer membrane protein